MPRNGEEASNALAVGRRKSASINRTRSPARRASVKCEVDGDHRLAFVTHGAGDEQFLQRALAAKVRQPRAQDAKCLGAGTIRVGDGDEPLFGRGHGSKDAVGRNSQPRGRGRRLGGERIERGGVVEGQARDRGIRLGGSSQWRGTWSFTLRLLQCIVQSTHF